jgi:endoglucanase Acf2
MRIFIFLLFTAFFSIQFSFSQTLRDFKKKTEENTKERTAMLDLLRSDIKNYLEQDVVFVVNHFKVYGSYAWMEGTVQRKDGKEIVFTEDAYDCCHVEALFKKVNGAWILKENGAFSTDVWYVCIVSNYPEASRQIFSEQILSNQENCRN